MIRAFLMMFSIEMFKVRRSHMIKIVALLFTIAPLSAAFFIFILQDPEFAQKAGLLGEKAQIIGKEDGFSYLQIHAQMIAVGGMIAYGFVTSWVFGREYVDQTVIELLCLPYPRSIFVIAKFSAAFVTNFLLTIYIITVGMIVGMLLQVKDLSLSLLLAQTPFLLTVTILTAALSFPVAFFASIGKGYLFPLGFVIVTLIFSQLITAIGFGHYFPWSIPALYSGMAGETITFNFINLSLLIVTVSLGFLSTLLWYLIADQDE